MGTQGALENPEGQAEGHGMMPGVSGHTLCQLLQKCSRAHFGDSLLEDAREGRILLRDVRLSH